MTYTFVCDGWCQAHHDDRPALMGEFNEAWFKSTPEGGHLSDQGLSPGDIVTLCGSCTSRLLLETTQ